MTPAGPATPRAGSKTRITDALPGLLERAARDAQAKGVHVDTHAREGDPAETIIQVAKEQQADLIVVGDRGWTGIQRFLLGSVSQKVSHHAPCSVMIVRPGFGVDEAPGRETGGLARVVGRRTYRHARGLIFGSVGVGFGSVGVGGLATAASLSSAAPSAPPTVARELASQASCR